MTINKNRLVIDEKCIHVFGAKSVLIPLGLTTAAAAAAAAAAGGGFHKKS